MQKKIISLIGLSLLISNLYGGFNFEGENGGCDGGTGDPFKQPIEYYDTVTIGTIDKGLKDVKISLKSDNDVDIQLYDKSNGKAIVKWAKNPKDYGLLHGPIKRSKSYNGVTVTYSGYNGDGTGKGHEYIEISGTAQNDFEMKAFGFKAGYAVVDYSWGGKENCSENSTPSASGVGEPFEQQILYKAVVEVEGTIPPGINNLYISLKSKNDVDVQLFDKDTGKALVGWGISALIGDDSGYATTPYKGMTIAYSGYNGDGTGLGNEYIKITGKTTCNLIMKAYGFKAGYAQINYKWGDETTPPTTKLKGLKFVSATPASGEDYAIVDETITFKATTYSSEDGKVKLFIQFYDGTNYGTEHAMHKSSSTLWFYNRELHSAGKEKKYKIIAKDLDGKVIKEAKGSIEVKEKKSSLVWPVPAYTGFFYVNVGEYNSEYGYHKGLDIFTAPTSDAVAICDGTVVYDVTNAPLVWNKLLIIEHKNCHGKDVIYGYYAHIYSSVSGNVKAGEVVGTVATWPGNKSNTHVHFGLNPKKITSHWGYATTAGGKDEVSNQGWLDPREFFNKWQ